MVKILARQVQWIEFSVRMTSMFQYPPARRHPLQTFEFWFLVIVGVGTVGAWKFGLLDLPSGAPDDVVASTEDDTSMIDRGGDSVPSGNDSTPEIEFNWDMEGTAPAPAQSEQMTISPNPTPPPIQTASAREWPATLSESENETTGLPPQQPETPALHPIEEPATAANNSGIRLASVSKPSSTPAKELPAQPQSILQLQPTGLDFTEVDALIAAGDDVSAHRKLSTWFWEKPDQRPLLMDRLNTLAGRIYFQPDTHYMEPFTVKFGDRLETIAKQYEVPWEYLSKLNRVSPEQVQSGKKLKVIQGPFHAVVNVSDFTVTIHAHGYYVTQFPCGIGRDGSTPTGSFKVTDKVVDPTYYGPDGIIKNDDPQNPLGERWLAISDDAGTLQGYGIHGTIDPQSIGKEESRGCVRLQNGDIDNLYDLLSVGSEVIIRR